MTDWAAKVLADVPRHNAQDAKNMTGYANAVWLHEDAVVDALAKLGAGDDMVERLLENDREIFLPLLGEAAAHIAALTAERDEALESVTNNNDWFGMHSTLWMWLITQPDMPQLDDLEDGGADEVARNYERAITALVDAHIAALTAERDEARVQAAGWEEMSRSNQAFAVSAGNRLIAEREAAEAEAAALRAKVARLEGAGDFARLIGNDAGKDDKDTVLVSYGMLRRLRDALTDGGKDG